MVGIERNAKSLTSLTSLAGADFRVVTGWGGAGTAEADIIGRRYRVLRTGMGYVQILALTGKRQIATNAPERGYGFYL